MADIKKPGAGQPIADVAHPGKTPPSETSKSVIVRSGPMLQDPMITSSSDTEEKSADEPKSPAAKGQVKLRPLEESSASPTEADKPETAKDDKTPEPTVDDKKDEASEPTKIEQAESEDKKTMPGDKGQGAELADVEAEEKKRAEHDAAIQKLADGKQFYLPINSVEKRKSKRFVAAGILLSLLLAVAWVDIALDAHLIQINGIKPVTHFFST